MTCDNCVEVDRDALESAGLMMEGVRSALSILREALENGDSNIDADVKSVCWLLERVVDNHIDMLETATAGKLTAPIVGEVASERTRRSLAELRGEISQREVAERAGITQAFYCEIEKGKKKPSVDMAKRIAEVLGFEWTKFFE